MAGPPEDPRTTDAPQVEGTVLTQPRPAPPAVRVQRGARFAGGLSAQALLIPGITLLIGWALALWAYASVDDYPDEFIGEFLMPLSFISMMVVAPVAVLFSWRELDLTAMGLVVMGSYLHMESADDGLAAAFLVAAVVGLLVGALVGLVRWLTHLPSAALTLGVSLFLVTFASKLEADMSSGHDEGIIRGTTFPVAAGLVLVTLAVVLALLAPRLFGAGSPVGPPGVVAPPIPRPGVIVGYALSGLGAASAGVLLEGMDDWASGDEYILPSTLGMLLPVAWFGLIVALGIGGVVPRSGVLAPLGGALGAAATMVAVGSFGVQLTDISNWDDANDHALWVSGVGLLCLGIAYSLHRVFFEQARPGTPSGVPPGVPMPPPAPSASPARPAPPVAPPGGPPLPSPDVPSAAADVPPAGAPAAGEAPGPAAPS